MTLKEKKEWAKKVKKYWRLREIAYGKFRLAEERLEKRMKKELGEELVFIYDEMSMGCVGVGHADYDRRKRNKNYFPLLQQDDLEG